MTMRLDSNRDCARAWEAMPWVMQGRAPQDQSEWLMQHLEHCADCRAEFEQQSRLRLALSLPSEVPLDPVAGLDQLMARLDNPEPVLAAADATGRGAPRVLRLLVAAVLVQAVGIGVLSVKLWAEPPQALYQTHSQPAAATPQGAIHVVPDSTMTLADWDAMLEAMHLKIVGGPNEVGAYTVVPQGSSASMQQVLDRLRAARGIRLAEPVVQSQ